MFINSNNLVSSHKLGGVSVVLVIHMEWTVRGGCYQNTYIPFDCPHRVNHVCRSPYVFKTRLS